MNILFVTDSFLPHAGGARVYYYNLYKRLGERFGDKVTIVTKKVSGWEEFDRSEAKAQFRIIRRAKPLLTWKYHQWPRAVVPFWECVKVLQMEAIDLIHFGDFFPPGVISLWLKHLYGVPYLGYCHGDELAQIERYRYQPMVRDRILRGASAVVAANRYARDKVRATGIHEEAIHTITPGVDVDRFRPLARNLELVRKYGLEGKLVLLTAARLVPKKGHETVLRAVAKLTREFPHLRYLIAGDGSDKLRLEQLAGQLGLDNVVIFTGDIPNDSLVDIYNLCDIFVMANRQAENGDIETFGMVFIEANATGKPVIGGRSGGAIEAVEEGKTGLLVNPEDVDDVARAIRILADNEHFRNSLGEAGLRRVREQFNWDTRCDYLHGLSASLVQRRESSPVPV